MAPKEQPIEFRTMAVLVDNEPGVLARVIGLFSGRGYNIESLTVTEVDRAKGLSRINLVTSGTPMVLEQIKAQLDRLVPIHEVRDLTRAGPFVERELALVKVVSHGEKRVECLRIADIFKAEVVDAGLDHFIFQVQHRSDKIDRFISLMGSLGAVEIARTGVVAMTRGPELMHGRDF
jgi:acetolactate synthase-1/3 small subunit